MGCRPFAEGASETARNLDIVAVAAAEISCNSSAVLNVLMRAGRVYLTLLIESAIGEKSLLLLSELMPLQTMLISKSQSC